MHTQLSSLHLRKAKKQIVNAGQWLEGIDSKILFIILLSILLIKSGFIVETTNIIGSYLPVAKLFPHPAGYFSSSFGNVIISRVLRINNPEQWIALHAFLAALALLIAAEECRQINRGSRNLALLLFISLPASANILHTIGKYDPIVYAGSFIFAFSACRGKAVIGSLIMAAGNPEQAFIACTCSYILSLSRPFARHRKICKLGVACSITVLTITQVWLALSGSFGESRLMVIPRYLEQSINQFESNPINYIWSLLGAFWVAFILILRLLKFNPVIIISCCIIAPFIFTLITLDGSRVFGLISLSSIIFTIRSLCSTNAISTQARQILFVSFLPLWAWMG